MIVFIVFLFILYMLFSSIYSVLNYNEYQQIYKFRCKLVDPEIYRLRAEFKQLMDEAIRSGSFSKFIQWQNNHPDFEDIPYTTITVGISQLNITLPDDGPYTNKEADKILYKRFGKYHLKIVKKVIKEYYCKTGTSRYTLVNNKKEDNIIDVEFTEVN